MALDLPQTNVTKLIKSSIEEKVGVSREAKESLNEIASIFISYLTANANEICKTTKRQTISAKDVVEALHEMEMDMLIPHLEQNLQALRTEARNKRQQKASEKDNTPEKEQNMVA